jgi:twitching motility protein PilT
MPNIEELLKHTVEKGASDLHIVAGSPPQIRIDEKLVCTGTEKLNPEQCKELAYSMLTPGQIAKFESEWELDTSFRVQNLSSFRVNLSLQRGSISVAIRAIPYKIATFDELGLPVRVVTQLSKKPKGLVLVTGATGSGKSTTIASMIDKINNERYCHIITVEDPIEYVYAHKKALINQRAVDLDTRTFAQALKHILRQDPDVIVIGEMRDLETIEAALTIAETGHLVLATLHTSDCVQTINRIVDVFPAHQQEQVRMQLSFVLLGVLSQQLIPRRDGKGRVLAAEVMLMNPAIRSLIRESKVHQIYSSIQTGQKEGMKTMNHALYELYESKLISYEEAISRSMDPDELEKMIKRG